MVTGGVIGTVDVSVVVIIADVSVEDSVRVK